MSHEFKPGDTVRYYPVRGKRSHTFEVVTGGPYLVGGRQTFQLGGFSGVVCATHLEPHEATAVEPVRLSHQQFVAVLEWFMVSDPWPLSETTHNIMLNLLNAEAEKRGYANWVDAYHRFKVVGP